MSASRATREILRKSVHISMVAWAFTLRYLTWWQASLLALTALVHNVFILPRYSRRALEREDDEKRGFALGIVLYPAVILALTLIYRNHLEIVAAMWGMLALGDGMAGIVGQALGKTKLRWNPKKSWAGTIAYVVFGGAGAAGLLSYTLRWKSSGSEVWFFLAVPFLTAAFCAFLESLDTGIDDNLTAPILGSMLLFGLMSTSPALLHGKEQRFVVGLLVNLAFAGAAAAIGGVGLSGAIVGIVLGTGIYGALGPAGFALLLIFFVCGTLATKIGYKVKAERGIAQERGGRRGARNALANVGAPFVLAMLATMAPEPARRGLLTLGFAASLATALSDTAASEIGKLWGRRTFLITTLRPVPRGTEGAISLEGTLAGLAGAAIIAIAGGPLLGWDPYAIAIVIGAGFAGMLLESLLGALLDTLRAADNDFVNFLNTVIGALIAMGIAMLLFCPGPTPDL